jgi:uncharacterized protein (DUF1697 family)
MNKYAAFLRGINVGGRIIKMDELSACFESMGFSNVKTFLQSGNVVFEADFQEVSRERQKIETNLTKTFHYPAIAFVYPLKTLKELIKKYPFESSSDYHDYMVLLEHGVAKELEQEAKNLDANIEQVSRGEEVIYWKVKKGMTLKSQFAKKLSTAKYKDFNTVRNLNTLKKTIT